MDAEDKVFAKDEVIFREGMASASAYMVVQGKVELTCQGRTGRVLVGLLGPNDFFGETALFDDTPYDVTARAAEKTTLRIMTRANLKEWLHVEQGASTRLGALLAERLRHVHRLMVEQAESAAMGKSSTAGSIWRFVSAWLKAKSKKKDDEGRGAFQIALATVNNDVEGAWTRALAALVEGRSGVSLRILPISLQIEPGADQIQTVAAYMRAHQALGKEKDVDLLVWGDVHADGYSLWFTPQGRIDDDRPGCFSPYYALELPGDGEPPAADLFHAALLAAVEPPEDRKFAQAQQLRMAIEPLADLIGAMPVSWNLEQQRTGLVAYGQALSVLALFDPPGPWGQQAVEAFRAAVNRVPVDMRGMEEAQYRKLLGIMLQLMGDRTAEPAWHEQSIGEFKSALDCIDRTRYPEEWGAAQNRLGLALYRLDLSTGRPELLKEAMLAFQSALQVFPRAEMPLRWAEVMHNLAQALQVYGDQMKNAEVLERAIETARAAIEFRPRNQVPFDWAASRNTLGTALFMLAKHAKGHVELDEAEAAINDALEVYRQYGAARLAEVTAKNLAHLQKLSKKNKVNAPASVHWFEVEDDKKSGAITKK